MQIANIAIRHDDDSPSLKPPVLGQSSHTRPSCRPSCRLQPASLSATSFSWWFSSLITSYFYILLPLPAAGLQPAWSTPPETIRNGPSMRPFHAQPMQSNPRSGARMPPFGPHRPTIPRQIPGLQRSCEPLFPRTRESKHHRTDLPPRHGQKKWAEMTPKRTGFNAEIMQNRPHFNARMPSFGPLFQANPRANFWPQAGLSSHSSQRMRIPASDAGSDVTTKSAKTTKVIATNFQTAYLKRKRLRQSHGFLPSRSSRTSWSKYLRLRSSVAV